MNSSIFISPLSDATLVKDLSLSYRKQTPTNVYCVVSPERRREIIRQIDNGERMSECKTGKKWWVTKHHPKQEIPQNIYLLGNGSLGDLHKRYVAEYCKENEVSIEYKVFINYTRELIKQGIMYEQVAVAIDETCAFPKISRYLQCDILIHKSDIQKYGFSANYTEEEMIALAMNHGSKIVVKNGEKGKWYLKGKCKTTEYLQMKIDKNIGKFRSGVYCLLLEY